MTTTLLDSAAAQPAAQAVVQSLPVFFRCTCGHTLRSFALFVHHQDFVQHAFLESPAPLDCGLCAKGDEPRHLKNRRTGKMGSGWYHVQGGSPIGCTRKETEHANPVHAR